MGKYTSLARKFREDEPQEEKPISVEGNKSVNISSSYKVISKEHPDHNTQTATNLRTTNLTNLMRVASVEPLRCIHGVTSDECAVCSGFVRWLIADEARYQRAQRNPEAARREFWRTVGGGRR
jgi:hypothetical protein